MTRTAYRRAVRPDRRGDGPPNVVAFTLEEARRILADAGWPDVDVRESRPPRRALAGPLRVIRQRLVEDRRVALVVCGEHAEDVRVRVRPG